MEELRYERRDGDLIIVATERGTEYSLIADDSLLAEVRAVVRQQRGGAQVSPAEIQRLLREGSSHDEIVELTGADIEDIERYEPPVAAELAYILSSANAVQVRTNTRGDDAGETFGDVLKSRLDGLGAENVKWVTRKDRQQGWIVEVTFVAREVDHTATWSFDHRKNLLAPLNGDATELSKQGSVGDSLIPKLRAVQPQSRAEQVQAPTTAEADSQRHATREEDVHEFERRQHIDEFAVRTSEDTPKDLGETQDLLQQLRRRRGKREHSRGNVNQEDLDLAFEGSDPAAAVTPLDFSGLDDAEAADSATHGEEADNDTANISDTRPARNDIWANLSRKAAEKNDQDSPAASSTAAGSDFDAEASAPNSAGQSEPEGSAKPKKRGRASMPSWDDILFGTRSEDDPADR